MTTQKKRAKLTARQEAADNATSAERLKALAEESDELARVVAKNPAAPIELLRTLCRSEDEETCKCVIANPYASFDILSDLERRFPMEIANNPALAFYNAIKP
jgi:hypothetical protein